MKLTARLTLTFWLIASSTAFKISVPPKISSNQSLPIQFIENGVDFDEGFIFDPSFPDDISDIPSDTVSAISDDNEHHKFSESDKPSPISTLSRGRQKKSEDLPIDQENDDDYTDGFDGFDNTFLDDSNSDFPIYDENFSNFSDSYVTDTSLNTSHGVSGNFSPSFPTPRKNSNELIDESDDYEYEYYSEDEFGDEDFEYDFGENFDDEEGEQKEDFDPFKFDFPEETYEQKNIIKKFAAWLNAQWNGFVDNVRSTNTRNQFEFTNLTDIKEFENEPQGIWANINQSIDENWSVFRKWVELQWVQFGAIYVLVTSAIVLMGVIFVSMMWYCQRIRVRMVAKVMQQLGRVQMFRV